MAIGVWLHLTEHHEHEHGHELLTHAHPHVHDEHHRHQHGSQDPPASPTLTPSTQRSQARPPARARHASPASSLMHHPAAVDRIPRCSSGGLVWRNITNNDKS